ncbi:GntR family transcriptional regulator [Uliginosibacterium sp. H3]|uniref:GntR family transcriptional regulator n=1 Tax=Uliginosibacterium silvisoli TaxID=3114758 RepID=A0ABU6K209_9RHOO|nr:GntR family transcriptional regulator [Uliginosibacterium sp. H3]
MPRSSTSNGESSSFSQDEIYAQIVEALVDQRMLPGTRLNELALCEVFKLSRREMEKVLLKLSFVGLVKLIPNRGAFVASSDASEARAILSARKIVEAGIVEAVALRATGADFKRLEQNIAREDECRHAGRMREAIKHSGEFHILLAEITGNFILCDLMKQLVARTSLVVSLYENPNGLSCWHGDHATLLRHLRAHKARPAMTLMQRHLDDLEESLVFAPQQDQSPDLRAIFGGVGKGRNG